MDDFYVNRLLTLKPHAHTLNKYLLETERHIPPPPFFHTYTPTPHSLQPPTPPLPHTHTHSSPGQFTLKVAAMFKESLPSSSSMHAISDHLSSLCAPLAACRPSRNPIKMVILLIIEIVFRLTHGLGPRHHVHAINCEQRRHFILCEQRRKEILAGEERYWRECEEPARKTGTCGSAHNIIVLYWR